MMRKHILFFFLLTCILCLPASMTVGESMTIASFFPVTSYYHIDYNAPEDTLAFDAVFYQDGYVHGVTDALEEIYGYYAIMPDDTLLLNVDYVTAQLDYDVNGSYSSSLPDINYICTMTPIVRSAFDEAVENADLYIDSELDRVDVPLWDYPVYVRITIHDGIDLLVNPAWPEISAGHLDAGTIVLIRGQKFDESNQTDYDNYLLEADGIRGFALSMGLEELMVRQAKVIRSPRDKGRTVNIRSTPDYGDNVIMEVPYGEIVDVFPVVDGEFTRVYYDYGSGWMTTIRLQIMDD